MPERPISCTEPVRGPILAASDAPDQAPVFSAKEMIMTLARVGKPAPDFEAMAYQKGGFKPVKLSDFAGHWILVCFYPGDFTFV
jgi:peroxiredoxin (alkyl hydroperoxide reductase subunit C)